MEKISQPIDVTTPEPGRDEKDIIGLQEFIKLLKEEEDYWAPDQNNTRLMISRLRKIFYDQWGWNSELIRGARDVDTRYQTVMKANPEVHAKEAPRYKGLIYTPVYRQVTYTDHDKVYGNTRVGQVPNIYQHDHQEVRLPGGDFCDIGHILAGLDAWNYLQVVSPLPSFLAFIEKLFPHVDSNVDIVTWLGDIASSSADFLFDYLKNHDKVISPEDEQDVIDSDAPGSDMLGDIEPYVIAKHYDVGTSHGLSFTEILTDYYFGNNQYRNNRYLTFAEIIGLKGWDGEVFSNEKRWLRYYRGQLRNSVCFVAYSQNEKTLRGILLPIKIWLGGYKKVLKMEFLLRLFLTALKNEITNKKDSK